MKEVAAAGSGGSSSFRSQPLETGTEMLQVQTFLYFHIQQCSKKLPGFLLLLVFLEDKNTSFSKSR